MRRYRSPKALETNHAMYGHSTNTRNIEALEKFFSEGREEKFLLKGENKSKWIPLAPAEKAGYARDLFIIGLSLKEDRFVKLAKKHGAKVDNDILCAAVVRQDKELFRGLVEQLDGKKIEWKKILASLLVDTCSLGFYQHIIDTYLGDRWIEFIPDEEDICSDADAYIALLKRCFKAVAV